MDLLLQLLVNGLFQGFVYAIIALGFALIFNTTKIFHLAHGAVYTFSAYMTYLFLVVFGIPLIPAVICSMILSGILGALIEIGFYRPMRRWQSSLLVILIASIGLLIFIENGIQLIFGSDMKRLASGMLHATHVGPVTITSLQWATLILGFSMFAALYLFLKYAKVGNEIRAITNDPEVGRIIGIDADRVYLVTMVIGSAMAAPASACICYQTGIHAFMGFHVVLIGAIAVIIGGVGSLIGAGLGAMLIAVAENVGIWKIDSNWQAIIAFGVLFFFILFRPTGFFGHRIWKMKV